MLTTTYSSLKDFIQTVEEKHSASAISTCKVDWLGTLVRVENVEGVRTYNYNGPEEVPNLLFETLI